MAHLCELWSHCWVPGCNGGIIWLYTCEAACQRRLKMRDVRIFFAAVCRNFGQLFFKFLVEATFIFAQFRRSDIRERY